jgi:hypothetical protein
MHRIRFEVDCRVEINVYLYKLYLVIVVSTMSVLPEGTTTIEYPRSKKKVVKDHKGNIISDSKK